METTENKVRYNENVNIKTGRIGHFEFMNCRSDKRIAKVVLYVKEIAGPKNANGEYPTKTTPFRVTFFEGNKGILPFEQLAVGAVIRCVGRDEIREYTNKHGEKAFSHDIIAFEVSLVSAAQPRDAAPETTAPTVQEPVKAAPADDDEKAFSTSDADDDYFNNL